MPPTLFVIDLQQGLLEGDPTWGSRSTPKLSSNVALVLDHWRHSNWPVLHIHHDDADPSHPLRQDHPSTSRAHACAVPLSDEPIIRKGVGSAFVASTLEEELRRNHVDEICLIGMEGTKCITNNARHASDLGFMVIVVADACASYGMSDYRDETLQISAEETHHAAMALLANDEARVVLTEELLRSFNHEK